jgi:tetratricopeptide (TPR) repeat protein
MSTGEHLGAIAALTILISGNAASQTPDRRLIPDQECTGSIRHAMAHVALGRLAEAEENLSFALSKVDGRAGDPCAGLILHNLATIASMSGRSRDAEQLAARSVAALERVYGADDPALWRPLLVLAGARLEQGKTPAARADLKRLMEIRPEQPQDRALIHGTVASLLQRLGERREAEVEYRAALQAWNDSGRGETVDVASVLTSLATLLIEDRRLEEARRAVERAAGILSHSKDALPMDRSKLLMVRGALHAGRREWPDAEIDLRDALAIADAQSAVDARYVLTLLATFTEALNRNHHRNAARKVEARAAALRAGNPSLDGVVDVSDLHSRSKSGRR